MNSALEYTTSGTRALEPISVVIRVVAVMAEGERKLEGSHKQKKRNRQYTNEFGNFPLLKYITSYEITLEHFMLLF